MGACLLSLVSFLAAHSVATKSMEALLAFGHPKQMGYHSNESWVLSFPFHHTIRSQLHAPCGQKVIDNTILVLQHRRPLFCSSFHNLPETVI